MLFFINVFSFKFESRDAEYLRSKGFENLRKYDVEKIPKLIAKVDLSALVNFSEMH